MSNPPSSHNQYTPDPVAHFKAIPWCADLLNSKRVLTTIVPPRNPLASTESTLMRETLNDANTLRACVCFLQMPTKEDRAIHIGETKDKPFVEMCALLDVGGGMNGRPHILHGGIFAVFLDEVLSTVAYQHSEHGAITAYMTITWKKPLFTPSVCLCKGRVVKKEGKKVFVKGSFHDADGTLLAEAEGLWILLGPRPAKGDKVEVKAKL